ncbi:response regulator transcription factor [Streptomyces sp. 135]|uniref:response regulator n=1 Tax=Streptomyces sp. 135 TaxID=2838850 RepID=UPI001CBD54A0|nr:response regulator transcription factor [Streptomyces sp. 135]
MILAEDEALLRGLLAQQLRLAGIEVVAEVEDGAAALKALEQHVVDVLLLDLQMPRLNGLDTLRRLKGRPHRPAVLVVTALSTDDDLLSALREGADGYVLKASAPADLVEAIERVARGESAVSGAMLRRLIEKAVNVPSNQSSAADRKLLASLTPHERVVVSLLGRGLSNQALAFELGVTVSTAKTYVSRLLNKSGKSNRTELALWGVQMEQSGFDLLNSP